MFDNNFKKLYSGLKSGILGRYEPLADEREEVLDLVKDNHNPKTIEETAPLIEAAERRPEEQRSPEDYLVLSTDAFRMQNYEKALDLSFAGLRLKPEDKRVASSLSNRLGTVFKALGVDTLAISNFDRALALDSDCYDPLYNLGLI